jgi:multiple sugar transport system ATP-binding protein
VDARKPPQKGDRLYLRVREGEQHMFSTTTGDRLPQ